MRNIEVHKQHRLGVAEARVRLKVIEKELENRFGAVLEWNGDIAAVIGRGVTGKVTVDDVGVTVFLRISFFFMPLVSAIRNEVRVALDREFPG